MRPCPSCGSESPLEQKFCGECGARLATTGAARRRLVTALFCDLVGSTELGERMDAEVLRKVLDRYFDAMRAAIERHGGTVEKFIGDAVVGAFGVPEAHEDDGLRAVRAALEMRAAAAELHEGIDEGIDDPGVRMLVRVGIDCGEAFADEAAAMQGRIVGDAFNTASRLQAAAEAGDVLVSGAAERMLRGRVELDPLGPIELKGKAEPVHAYRVVSIRAEPVRLETPLVGRDRPLRELEGAFEDAVGDQACVLVTVLAPPGVGKSRLAAAFAERVRGRATVLIGQTPSYGEGVTFAPLVELLSQAAERPGGDAEQVAAALRERLAAQPDGAAVGERIAQVLGVGEALASDASWAVRRLIEVLAAERPVVVVLEDIHWAEPPMLDLADAVVDRAHGPVLFLCLARPELLEQRPTWAAGKPRATTRTLPPLPPKDARRVTELLLGSEAPAVVVDRVCERAEGNPLYLEQLTAMLADHGLLADGRWVGSDDADVEIPATLQALLAARIDRLDPTPLLVLERASVEGRRFRIAALRALAPEVDLDEVDPAIAALERKGLVQPEDEARGWWRFAHALVLEAAYRGLSKELRSDLHERLADWMKDADADQPDVDESVARHLERSVHLREELGVRDDRTAAISARAGELFALSGARAFAALDYLTAVDLLERAEVLLPPRSPRRLDLLPNLAVALMNTGRADEVEGVLSEGAPAVRSGRTGRDVLRARVQLLRTRIYRSSTETEVVAAAVEARDAYSRLASMLDDVGAAEAALAIAQLGHTGERRAQVQSWTLRALRHAVAAGRVGETSDAASTFAASVFEGSLPYGEFPAAAAELSSLSEDPICDCTGHALLTLAALASGEGAAASEHERRFREVVERHGLTGLGAEISLIIAEAEVWTGTPEAGERRLHEVREVLEPLGDIWWTSSIDSILCQAVWAQDRPRDFLRMADAHEASAFVGDRAIRIGRQSIRARAQLLRGRAHEAELSARRGVEMAEGTDLLQEHARALLTLSEILEARGRADEGAAARRDAIAKLRTKGYVAAIAHLDDQAAREHATT